MVKWIGLIAVLAVVAYFALPKFRTEVNNRIENLKEWDEEARRKDPVGYIEYSMKKLSENVGKFEDLRSMLQTRKTEIVKARDGATSTQAFAEKSAAAFKAAYQSAKKDGKWPVTVAGKAYSEADLKAQVGLTLGELDVQKSLIAQYEPVVVDLDARLNEVVARFAETKGKLEILTAQRTLVKAANLSAETEKMLGQVQDVLVQNEQAISKSPVRTVSEMMKADQKAAAAANPAVDAFLNG